MARFTAANAREMAAKSHAARRQRLASGEPTAESDMQMPHTGPHGALDSYVARRLARVRRQLDSVDAAIEKSIGDDSKRLKELTDAQMRLAEQERQLSGRPLPGSRRPAPERQEHRRGLPGGIASEASTPPPVPTKPLGWECDSLPG